MILDVFGSVNARSGALDQAIRLLITAAETGKHDDIAAATEQIERSERASRAVGRGSGSRLGAVRAGRSVSVEPQRSPYSERR